MTENLRHTGLAALLADMPSDAEGVFSSPRLGQAAEQSAERELRERVAAQQYGDYLGAISESHSVQVMDHEVARFLHRLPPGAVILDIGGCWGWHWRRLAAERPDVGVLIVDFVRANLGHARRVLGPLIGRQVELMHADATALPFPDATAAAGFDAVWTVQVFQHIPDFARACAEAQRVLKPGGRFANYSLHTTPLNRAVYRLFGKRYHTEGMVGQAYYLARASDEQRQVIARVFGAPVEERYTECLFHPDLKLSRTGRLGSMLGAIDARLGSASPVARLIARQRSFEVVKR